MLLSEIVVGQSGIAHDASLRAGLQILVAVNGYHYTPPGRGVTVDVVAPVDPRQRPAAPLQHATHLLAGDDFHDACPAASRATLTPLSPPPMIARS